MDFDLPSKRAYFIASIHHDWLSCAAESNAIATASMLIYYCIRKANFSL